MACGLGSSLPCILGSTARNEDFRRVTSPALARLGHSPTTIWKKVVKNLTSFNSVSTEQLFGRVKTEEIPRMKGWLEYTQQRYMWVVR